MAARRNPAPQRAAAPASRPASALSQRAVDAILDDEADLAIVTMEPAALESITKSEVGMQLDAAHRWPRSIKRFLEDAEALATMTQETAASCMYTLPSRGNEKPITGPSVRLAEMCATAWGNLHTGARIIELGARDVTAQALAWDLEKNLRLSIEVKRGIMTSGKGGKLPVRFGDDMIRVTSMAAISIALRNAIFRIIPRALVDSVYEVSKAHATGESDAAFQKNRDKAIGWLVHRQGVDPVRIFARLQVRDQHAMTREDLAALLGWIQAIKGSETSADEIFGAPPPPARTTSKASAIDDMVKEAKARKSEPPANDSAQLTPAEVHAALADADEDWAPDDRLALITGWSPAEQRIAYDWAVAFVDTPQDEPPPEQPEFTLIGRQMGED